MRLASGPERPLRAARRVAPAAWSSLAAVAVGACLASGSPGASAVGAASNPPSSVGPSGAAAPPAIFPDAGAVLTVLDVPAPALRLVLDPGHGAPGNSGNTNARCELEQDVMLRVAGRVAPALRERGLTVDLSRATNEVSYDDRLALTNTRDVLVSLHSDARAGTSATLGPGGCRQTLGASGLSVLWSDEGPVELVERRHRLARAVARRMGEAGFHLYEGTDYLSLYEGDEVAGVFVDRHAIDERIRLLRRPLVPSIIIETHDAGDVGEVARWEDPATSTAFAAALAAGIADAWAPPAVPSTQWGPPPSGSGP